MSNHTARSRVTRAVALGSVAAMAMVGLAACSSSGSGSNDKVGVSLIVKTTSNPYFVSMEQAAKQAAAKDGVALTLAAGKEDGDTDTQIQAIENSISRGDKGILITPNGPAVNNEIAKARKAGLYVIALDTAPDPANTVDITYATDNFAAGEAIGKWTAAKLDGKKAVMAMVDLNATQNITVDYERDTGFLTGMGIKVPDKNKNGSEAPSGKYTGGKGGDYQIAGHQPSQGAEDGGRTAMETILSKTPNVNVVYAINEPAAYGAYQALKAAGKTDGVLLVGIDGGCTGVGYVKQGILGATSQQYPSKMATEGMEAIVKLAKTGKKASTSAGLDFHNTGSQLITDQAVAGLKSIDSSQGSKLCWGK
ncbi:substrate-binding domain-containing protein [Rathayibacter sp. KR2-224]|uniref:substrate-binding domain-containing protein n=1 Tax=Rathayibacter sp. KR2-224 TaxID=3400913 RepID=UPI003C0921D2